MRLAELAIVAFLHLTVFALLIFFGAIDLSHPNFLAYLAAFFIILSAMLFTYIFHFRRQFRDQERKIQEEEKERKLLEGQLYIGGELEAIPSIKEDINRLPKGATISIFGTGATSIVHIAQEVFDALARGVNFNVFVLNPKDFLVDRLSFMEPDFEKMIATPIIASLKEDENIRKLLDGKWCDDLAAFLAYKNDFCSLHTEDGEVACTLHGRVICACVQIWKRVDSLVRSVYVTRPDLIGSFSINGHDMIPSIKAWRFVEGPAEKSPFWYYVADHIYHKGVGVDNPMRRIDGSISKKGVINIPYFETYMERAEDRSEPLLLERKKLH